MATSGMRRLWACGVLAGATVVLAAAPAHAEFTKFKWKSLDQPAPREVPGFAFDASRGRAVLFGGVSNSGTLNDVWEWNGKVWAQSAPFFAPNARSGAAMIYDARAGRVGLFGGAGASVFADTWLWNGSSWLNAQPSKAPPARLGASVAYDSTRERWLLFGGRGGNGAVLNDTWEFDSTTNTWIEFAPAVVPGPRWYGTAAFHKEANRVILAGGLEDFISYRDTWEWNGSAGTWTELIADDPGSALGGAALVYDEARKVLVEFGGIDNSYSDRTFEFTYADKKWTQRSSLHKPPAVPAQGVYDSIRERVVLYQGDESSLWEWDGSDWARVGPGASPPTRGFSQVAYDSDRKRVVLFGGSFGNPLGDTWEWDGGAWHEKSPALAPSARYAAGIAYDSTHKNTVLFSGFDSQVNKDETWTWDGETWTLRSPLVHPEPRLGSLAAHDAVRGKTVLVGGVQMNGMGDAEYPEDTWEWDGTTWAKATLSTSPGGRILGAMAFDPERQRVVLFGGSKAIGFTDLLDDTWTFDGITWTKATPAHHPSARYFSKMSYDSNRKTVMMFGGVTAAGASSELWQWDGTDWTLLDVEASPVTSGNTVAFSFDGNTVMTFGTTIRVNNASTTLLLVPKTDTCTADQDCANETYCVDGVCCASKACNGCETCNGLSPGICSPIFNGEDPDTCSQNDGKSCGPKGTCQRSMGAACSASAECASGFCVDGVCCESRCDSTCVACTAALKADGSRDGLCGVAKPGLSTTETCGTFACFDDTHLFAADGTQGTSCGGYRCVEPSGCRTGCASIDDCASAAGYVCDFDGRCVEPVAVIEGPAGCSSTDAGISSVRVALFGSLLALGATVRRRRAERKDDTFAD